MQLSFYGKQKEGTDSFIFFQKLEELGLDYNVDLKEEVINISKIKEDAIDQIVKIIQETFNIVTIKTEASTPRERTDIGDALKKVEDTLKKKKFTTNELRMYVKCICSDLQLIDLEPKSINIVPGEIVECEFGLARKEESYGKVHALVLLKTPSNTYWVLPMDIKPTEVYYDSNLYMLVKKDEDAMYCNETYKSKNAILYLDRVREVSSVRCLNRFGKVTAEFLLEVKKRVASLLIDGDGIKEPKNKSLNDILEEVIRPALERSLEENHVLNMEIFFREMKIPTDSIYLSKAFEMAYSHKEKTLCLVLNLLRKDEGLDRKEVLSKIEKPLRKEFVDWMKSEYYSIYESHIKISLGDVLKVFINSLEKR